MSDPPLVRARVQPDIAAEFPGLAAYSVALEARSGRSPQAVKQRLRAMSNRISGAQAVQMRQEPIPWAYRVFFRQVGIDPDERRTPVEQVVLNRLKWGGFRSRSLLDDAITIATFETGVGLVAFDADRLDGELELRVAREGELMGEQGRPLSKGQIVIADSARPLSILFSDMDPARGVTPETTRMLVAAVQVSGVPDISVEEALWTVAEIVTGAG